jgi:hypothetical protein
MTNRFGEVRAHPLVAVKRDARLAVARLARELRITEPEAEDPRPPRLTGRRTTCRRRVQLVSSATGG